MPRSPVMRGVPSWEAGPAWMTLPFHCTSWSCVKGPTPQEKLEWGVLLGPRPVGRTGESSEEKPTPSSPAVLAWCGWGSSLFRAPSSCRGLPSVRGLHSWRGGDLGLLGDYVNPLGKPKTGDSLSRTQSWSPGLFWGEESGKDASAAVQKRKATSAGSRDRDWGTSLVVQ